MPTLTLQKASLPRNPDTSGPGTMQVSDRGGGRLVMAIAHQRMTLDDTGSLDRDDVAPGFVLDAEALFESLDLD